MLAAGGRTKISPANSSRSVPGPRLISAAAANSTSSVTQPRNERAAVPRPDPAGREARPSLLDTRAAGGEDGRGRAADILGLLITGLCVYRGGGMTSFVPIRSARGSARSLNACTRAADVLKRSAI